MTHSRKNKGVCSGKTTVDLDENGIIRHIEVDYGCDGNLQGVCRLLEGRPAAEAIPLIAGIRCEDKSTSCPHQISLCLQEALDKLP